jgi:membrane protease YdiL (CAAX protease family)
MRNLNLRLALSVAASALRVAVLAVAVLDLQFDLSSLYPLPGVKAFGRDLALAAVSLVLADQVAKASRSLLRAAVPCCFARDAPGQACIDAIQEATGVRLVCTLLHCDLLGPLLEEFVFRGLLWPRLGLVGTSALFVLCHYYDAQGVSNAVILVDCLVHTAFFGMLRAATGNLWACTLMHMLGNMKVTLSVLRS